MTEVFGWKWMFVGLREMLGGLCLVRVRVVRQTKLLLSQSVGSLRALCGLS